MGRIKGKPITWIDMGFKENTFNLMKNNGEMRELTSSDELEFKRLSRKYFECKNVYDNRVLAQRIGVESATTLSKQELIEKLMEKVWGVQYFAKGFQNVKEIEIGKMDADTELALLEDVKRGDVIIGEEYEGVFEAKEEGGVLWSDCSSRKKMKPNVYVLRNITGEYALKDGDLIKGRIRFVDEVGYYCLFHIDTLNGIPVSDGKRPDNSSNIVRPYEKLTLAGNDRIIMGLQLFAPVCYGQFGVVSTNGRMDFCAQAVKIFNALDRQVLTPYLFLLQEKDYVIEDTMAQFGEDERVCCTRLGDNKTSKLLRLLQYVSAQARSNGSRHVVVVSDLDMLEKDDDSLSVSKLASFACAYSNGGSVTIIAMADSFSPLSAYHVVRNRIDFELALKSNVSVSKNVIDMLSSYSFSAREIPKEEAVALAKLQQFAVTEGNNAVERRLAGFESANDIIAQLNE